VQPTLVVLALVVALVELFPTSFKSVINPERHETHKPQTRNASTLLAEKEQTDAICNQSEATTRQSKNTSFARPPPLHSQRPDEKVTAWQDGRPILHSYYQALPSIF